MEVEYESLPETFEKNLILYDDKDDEDEDEDDDDVDEWDLLEFEIDPEILREKARQIVMGFLKQVEYNQFSEFPWPPDPDCPIYKFKHLNCCIPDLDPEEEKSETAKRFLDQVRKSWGYDVDCKPPFYTQISPVNLQRECGVGTFRIVRVAADCVIDRINAEAEKIGKKFEIVRVNKAVTAAGALYLLTLTLKDVKSNAEITVRATVANPPPCLAPELMELKLIPFVPI